MSLFKEGDAVICIDDEFAYCKPPSQLSLGALYFIVKDQHPRSSFVDVKDNNGVRNIFLATRFRLKEATLQEVVDTIEEFARALVTPPIPIAGQIWSHKKTKKQIHIIFVHDEYIWVQNKAGPFPSPFTTKITQLWERFTYASDG